MDIVIKSNYHIFFGGCSMNLKEKLKRLPSSPGVYLMKDSLNSIIYVGKSKNLKNRVSSYFQNSKSHSSKVAKLVKNLNDFDYISTDTEFEAFMLECKLIKAIKPLYNRKMKNPKSYCYIKININEKYPEIDVSNEYIKNDKNIYFGPYTSSNMVKNGLQCIKEYYKVLCNNRFQRNSSCLNYSLGLCAGMCLNKISKEHYLNLIIKTTEIIRGNDRKILQKMKCKMNTSAQKFDFESASKYRDYITAIEYLINKFQVIKFTEYNNNIVLLEHLNAGIIKLFLIRGSKMLFNKKYELKDFNSKKLKSLFKTKILFYFNTKHLNSPTYIGKYEIDECQIIYTYLKNRLNNCSYIIIPESLLNVKNSKDIDMELDKLF